MSTETDALMAAWTRSVAKKLAERGEIVLNQADFLAWTGVDAGDDVTLMVGNVVDLEMGMLDEDDEI